MNNFREKAQIFEKDLIDLRRKLHQNPELGCDLPITTQIIKGELEKLGCTPNEICPSAVETMIGDETKGPTILLRVDCDALPMKEESGLPFASPFEARAHTCGHDIHTTMLLGAAKLLKDEEKDIKGAIKLIFQPGEEDLTGARAIIDAGVLKNPTPSAALTIHVQPLLPLEQLNYSKGAFLSSSDALEIEIEGKGCHGSLPHMGIDPVSVAAHIILALQSLQVKEVPAEDRVVLNICEVKSGSATNITPTKAVLRGTFRTYNQELRNKILKRIEDVCNFTAKAFGAKSTLNLIESCPTTKNDPELVDKMKEYIEQSGVNWNTNWDYTLQVSDDFGFISLEVPSVMFIIGCKPNDMQSSHNHNSKVVYDESVIAQGAALLADCAFNYLNKY